MSHTVTTASSYSTLINHVQHPMPDPGAPAPSDNDSPTSDASVSCADSTVWSQNLSASFGAIVDQINAAFQTLEANHSHGDTANALAGIAARLRMIEENQERLAEELQAVKAQLGRHHTNGKEREEMVIETLGEEAEPVDLAKAVQELTKKVDGLANTVKLDQQRLHARLMNSNITTKKETLKPVIGNNGKPPQNYPATKGEFEHITKERYEEFMKAYGLPIKGDTNTKREVLREFLGLTPLQ
ncbi:hypothetical protein SCP_1000150 [Sparassis crispa]|uniref:SAP domain-containing protein n=1 Tax=Sparassis crispa TaxID=139825 RepID=A0A401GX61_9APHY|nr:hypothetical protein SCP_1000150 [Sparassis crispa]GBE86773.1 hypothetical protein SCP_1000150 [Sparassis crispa]